MGGRMQPRRSSSIACQDRSFASSIESLAMVVDRRASEPVVTAAAVDALIQFSHVHSLLRLRSCIQQTHRPMLVFDDIGNIVAMSHSCRTLLRDAIQARDPKFLVKSLNIKHLLMPASVKHLIDGVVCANEKRHVYAVSSVVMTNRGQDLVMRMRVVEID
jgi:hypothetical protein